MKRFISVNVISGSELFDYSSEHKVFGPSQADKSHFVPVTDLSQIVGNMTASEKSSYYDFPDGNDTGASVPLTRKREDLAVLITEGRKLKKEVDSEISEAIENEKHRQIVDNLINGSVSSSDSSKE